MARALDARERARRGSGSCDGRPSDPPAADVERLTRRLRACLSGSRQRDSLDRVEQRLPRSGGGIRGCRAADRRDRRRHRRPTRGGLHPSQTPAALPGRCIALRQLGSVRAARHPRLIDRDRIGRLAATRCPEPSDRKRPATRSRHAALAPPACAVSTTAADSSRRRRAAARQPARICSRCSWKRAAEAIAATSARRPASDDAELAIDLERVGARQNDPPEPVVVGADGSSSERQTPTRTTCSRRARSTRRRRSPRSCPPRRRLGPLAARRGGGARVPQSP